MSKEWIRRVTVAAFAGNLIAIVAAAASGLARGAPAFRFEEKEAITFLSSNQLGATALLAWIVYLLREHVSRAARGGATHRFWAVSAVGFLYLMLDESFQFHEGMDTAVVRLFGGTTDPMVDGAATLVYGIAAAALCWWFRSEITRYPEALRFFWIGGAFLLATSLLNAGEATPSKIVLEESAKLLGVASFLVAHLAAFAGVLSEIRHEPDTPRLTEPRGGLPVSAADRSESGCG